MRISYRRGFTLLEVMVAITIMGLVFTSIFKMHSQTISMTFISRFYSIAPLLCQKKIGDILKEKLEDESEDSGNFGDDYPNYTWQVSVAKVSAEDILEKEMDMFQIDVTVSLDENGLSHHVRTYRLDNSDE